MVPDNHDYPHIHHSPHHHQYNHQVLQLLETQRANVGEVKAEAEERELELMTKVARFIINIVVIVIIIIIAMIITIVIKVKELEEEYELFLEELVSLVGSGEEGEKKLEVVERVAALIQAEISLKKQVG